MDCGIWIVASELDFLISTAVWVGCAIVFLPDFAIGTASWPGDFATVTFARQDAFPEDFGTVTFVCTLLV